MTTDAHRACESVNAIPGREPFTFIIRSHDNVLLQEDQEVKLGKAFSEHAPGAKRQFAAVLAELAAHLSKQGRGLSGRPEAPDSDEPTGDGIRLDAATCKKYLVRLRELGAGLRGMLSPELIETSRPLGFPADREEDEPALTFLESGDPILWEMLYEGGSLGPPDWHRFWGFRAPITHWMIGGRSTPRGIRVSNGVFAFVSENLKAAATEVQSLVARLEGRIAGRRHGSLDRALRELILRDKLAPAEELELPRQWLRCPLEKKSPDERKEWKDQALVEILKEIRSHYELVHFACHCAATTNSELYSRLEIEIAGEPLSLTVALLSSNFPPAGRGPMKPGPLVFLNACGSAQPNPAGDAPGFPDIWIQYGAHAVIATVCPVPDHFANAFADKFYEYLFEGGRDRGPDRYCFLAEALLATRRYFMQECNNPLGLAYVLYARKGFHVLPEGPPG